MEKSIPPRGNHFFYFSVQTFNVFVIVFGFKILEMYTLNNAGLF